jgi:hypothetical protein
VGQDRVQYWALVNMVRNFLVFEKKEICRLAERLLVSQEEL